VLKSAKVVGIKQLKVVRNAITHVRSVIVILIALNAKIIISYSKEFVNVMTDLYLITMDFVRHAR
jgi:hypothetical protein